MRKQFTKQQADDERKKTEDALKSGKDLKTLSDDQIEVLLADVLREAEKRQVRVPGAVMRLSRDIPE